MSFGTLCSSILPTTVGDFAIHVLPERIALGRQNIGKTDREVVALVEHVALVRSDFDPARRANIHVIQEDVFNDLMAAKQPPKERRLTESLKEIGGSDNDVLIIVRSPDTAGMLALKHKAARGYKQNLTIASPQQVVNAMTQSLGLTNIAATYIAPNEFLTKPMPNQVPTEYGDFNVQTRDVAECAVMPAIAWNTLFPSLNKPLVEGEQPLVLTAKKHVALISSKPVGEGALPLVRVHSSCFTSMCAAKNCDCGQQFDQGLKIIAEQGGVMLHHDAEGRGANLALKILMNELKRPKRSGPVLDTYQAMHVYGLRDDERNYTEVAHFLSEVLPCGFNLLTNNTDKAQALRDLGAKVMATQRILADTIHPEMVPYLDAKGKRSHPAYAGQMTPETLKLA